MENNAYAVDYWMPVLLTASAITVLFTYVALRHFIFQPVRETIIFLKDRNAVSLAK